MLSTYCIEINFINILLHIYLQHCALKKLYFSSCTPKHSHIMLLSTGPHFFHIVPCSPTLIVFSRIHRGIFLYTDVLLVLSYRHCYLYVPASIVYIDVYFLLLLTHALLDLFSENLLALFLISISILSVQFRILRVFFSVYILVLSLSSTTKYS